MFIEKYEGSFGYQLWFISTIIQLYILFIPMCLLKRKINNDLYFFTLFLSISAIWWLTCTYLEVNSIRVWNSFCLQYIWEFSLGIIIATHLLEGKTIKINLGWILFCAITGLVLQAIMAVSSEILKSFNDIPALFGYLCLALLISKVSLINNFFKKISLYSYELYLVHILIFSCVFHFTDGENHILMIFLACISLCISLIVANLYRILTNKIQKLILLT